jgi:1-acyl-sn-glycerol-3-phosphate acyltransferase
LFYKNIIVEGTENIPDGYPLIFAPNHQNALMDPMAVNFACDKQIVFMARSDVFRDKFAIKALTFLKVLPVFRIRDGKDKLSNNDLTFDIAVRVLESKMHIGIFPEARHTDKRRLLGLKKGIPRLAFLAEERNDFKLDIKIVPVGIYYSKYNRMRNILHVRFGKPISVLDFKDEYLENQQKAMLSLRDVMSNAISPLIIDIRSSELYDTYESIRRLYVKNLVRRFKLGKLTQINKFKADKITIQAVAAYEKDNPKKMQDIKLKVEKYEDLKKKYKLSDQSVEKPYLSLFRIIINSFIILICIPPFIYGLVINLKFEAYFLDLQKSLLL